MTLANNIFRAYDIRGVVDKELDEQVVYGIGRALATMAQEKGCTAFCIGYDGRFTSPAFAQSLRSGLCEGGIDVIDIGLVPTPLLYFATAHFGNGCGVMVTGSHNPPDYNGLKMMIAAETLAEQDIQEIRRRVLEKDFSRGKGQYRKEDITADYIRHVVAQNPDNPPKKVVLDAGNGATGEIAPQLFSALGYTVIPLFCDIDGAFPNHHPDPGNPQNLRDLQQAVREHNADIGFAFDGDGDRIGIVTDAAEIVFPDKALMLYAEDLLSRKQATIVVDVKSSPLLVEHIAQHGGQAIVWKTGHSLIKKKMKETGALLGGEMSGHIFFAENWYGFDDGLLAAARLLRALHARNQKASAIFSAYPSWAATPEITIPASDDDKFSIVKRLVAQGDFGDCAKNCVDGIRVEYPNSWGLVRCSNTTPMLVLRFEGKTTADLQQVASVFYQQLREHAPQLDLQAIQQYL